MSFALYRRPGGVIFLDDDFDYLEMLVEVMPSEWYVRAFLRPVACIDVLLKELDRWEQDAWSQQEIVNRWREGTALIPQILSYWREDAHARFALTRVLVVDYSMPAMSGLRVLGELGQWSGSRILLTGRADEQLAVSAFNRGILDQFIPKQAPEIRMRVTQAIVEQMNKASARHQQTWRATLSRQQNELLADAHIAAQLEALAVTHGWIEHVVIGAPFGVLALDRSGKVQWLQLEPAANLPDLAEMAQSQGWDSNTVHKIASGNALIDLELQLPPATGHKPKPTDAFSMGAEPAVLYAAIFDIAEQLCPGADSSHSRFVGDQGGRKLQD